MNTAHKTLTPLAREKGVEMVGAEANINEGGSKTSYVLVRWRSIRRDITESQEGKVPGHPVSCIQV